VESQIILEEDKRILLANFDRLGPEKQKQFAVALLAEKNYENSHPLQAYQPQPKQLEFHINGNKVRAVFGANQSGKTYCGAREAAFHATGDYPEWYPKNLRIRQPNRGRIIVKDFPKGVGEVMEPALLKAIPPRYIRNQKRNSQGYLVKLSLNSGSTIDLVTHDMDTQSLEGWQGHWIWCDEPPPRDKWVASMRGLIRLAGRVWLTCTPLEEPWMYDELYINTNYFSINIDIADNTYLSKDEVQKFSDMLNEDEKEARLHGRFMHLSGLTFKEFDVKTHIKDSLPEDAKTWPRWQIVDPHTRKPFAIIYGAVDPIGRKWIYDEWPKEKFHTMRNSQYTPTDYKHLFSDIEKDVVIYRRIMDGRFCKQPMGAGGDSLLEIFDDLGVHFEPSYITTTLGTTDPGYLKLKDALRVSMVTSEPDLFVTKNCHNVIYSFQHNTWQNFRDDSMGIKEKPSEFAKDFLDVIRYWFMDDPKYFVEDRMNTHGRSTWVADILTQDSQTGTYGSQREW
jgi:hypothetical protein